MSRMRIMSSTRKKAPALVLAGTLALFTLSGCTSYEELVPDEEYSVLNKNKESNGLLNTGLIKTLAVPGETFKLATQYTCSSSTERKWLITSDKFLYFKVNTEGLPADTQVYIDNVHIDVSIKSDRPEMNGIMQDNMDDRVHNAQMIGFPIADNTNYYGVFGIEGCNQDFIQGTFFGYNGYSSGTVEEERYTEEDYRKFGVTHSKFQFVYDLLVKGPNDRDYRNISISDDFLVPVDPIEYLGSDGKVYVLDGDQKVLKQNTK